MTPLTSTDTALLVAGAGKIFIEIADSMPPLSPTAPYYARWIYGFMQKLASNGLKAQAAQTSSTVTLIPNVKEKVNA